MIIKRLDEYCDRVLRGKLHGVRPVMGQVLLLKVSLWIYDPITMLKIKHYSYRIKNIEKRK